MNKRLLLILVVLLLVVFIVLIVFGVFFGNKENRNDIPPNSLFNHLGALQYFTDDLFDTEYRCSAVLMSPNHMLTTTNCDGSQFPSERPLQVLLGSQSANKKITIAIKNGTEIFGGVLVLNYLSRPISEMEFATKVSVVPRCKDVNLNKETKLLAVGFGQNKNGRNCALFRQKVHLISSDKCKSLGDNLNSKDHVCVKPGESYPSAEKTDDCEPCLTASASVLHVHQADGSICVVGLATPTTKECIVNSEPVYYTLLENLLGAREFH